MSRSKARRLSRVRRLRFAQADLWLAGPLAALAAATSPLAAQAPMVPLHGGPIQPGAELSVTVGFNDDDVAELRGTSYAASFGYGFGRVGLAATAGTFDAKEGRSRRTLGALATLHLYGDGITTPLTLGLFGGAGWMAESDLGDDVVRHFPLGATAALTIATPVLSIRPWLAPRLDVLSCDPPNAQDVAALCWDTGSRFGLSAGIDLLFPKGFALRALSDYVDGGSPFVGAGAAYSF